jgi:tRNA U54 and U55 pseudouridine synthase Pus10
MTIAKGSLATVTGSLAVWEVVSAGPKRVRVRLADLSAIRTVYTVPAAAVTPYNPSN